MTTLLSKEAENRARPCVSPEQLAALQQQVLEQGGKVKEAKAVRAVLWACCLLRCECMCSRD